MDNSSYKDFRLLCFWTPFMLLLRYSLEKYCFSKIGKHFGVRNRVCKINSKQRCVVSSGDEQQSQVESYPEKPTKSKSNKKFKFCERRSKTTKKFCESSWRFSYYTIVFGFGLYVLWDKPWLWDINECWNGFPGKQHVTTDVKMYYFISLSFYLSSFINHFFDTKRRDFWQMLVHHIAAIVLLVVSWATGTYRIGSLVLVLHDFADIFLELTKVIIYTSWFTGTAIAYYLFAITWSVTRLWVLPFKIIRNTAIDAPKMVHIPAYYVVNGFLILLQILHCYWTFLIYRGFYNYYIKNKVGDSRSDSETTDTEVEKKVR